VRSGSTAVLSFHTSQFPSYRYSSTLLAHPLVWTAGVTPDRSLISARAISDVIFPSAKVVLWEWELPYVKRALRVGAVPGELAEQLPMAFSDGHGQVRLQTDALQAVLNPFGASGGCAFPQERLGNTEFGVSGRDY
jgi:hypothetical protein